MTQLVREGKFLAPRRSTLDWWHEEIYVNSKTSKSGVRDNKITSILFSVSKLCSIKMCWKEITQFDVSKVGNWLPSFSFSSWVNLNMLSLLSLKSIKPTRFHLVLILSGLKLGFNMAKLTPTVFVPVFPHQNRPVVWKIIWWLVHNILKLMIIVISK